MRNALLAAMAASCLVTAGAQATTVAEAQSAVTTNAVLALREATPVANPRPGTPGPLPFMPVDTGTYDPAADPSPGVYLLVPFDGRMDGGAMLVAPVRSTRGGLAPGLLCHQC